MHLMCVREGTAPNPLCKGYLDIGNLRVSYNFQRNRLSEAEQIEASLLKLIESFMVNGPN